MNLRLAAVALNQTPLDWPGNESRLRATLADARGRRASRDTHLSGSPRANGPLDSCLVLETIWNGPLALTNGCVSSPRPLAWAGMERAFGAGGICV